MNCTAVITTTTTESTTDTTADAITIASKEEMVVAEGADEV